MEEILTETVTVDGLSGAAGFVGVGAAVVVVNDRTVQEAYIAGGTRIDSAGGVFVTADGRQTFDTLTARRIPAPWGSVRRS